MEAITPFHHLNPPFRQNSLTKKSPRNSSTLFSLLRVAETQVSDSLPFLSSSCLNGYHEANSLYSVKIKHAQMDLKSLGGDPFEILEVFCELHNKRVVFDSRILAVILKICATLNNSLLGMEVHTCLIKRGFDIYEYSRCALMNFYGKCWGIQYVDQVFDEMPDRGVLLWNEAVLVNFRNERWVEALQSFRDMKFSYVRANSFTLAKVIQACGKLKALDLGKQIHGYVIRFTLDSNVLICNSLTTMYTRNSNLELARAVFDLMENRSISSWNSIISSYTALGSLNDAWKLFYDMETCNMKPDFVTWNCLLSGHFHRGLYREVLVLLQRMQAAGFKPNSSSITTILQAISELSLLNFGKEVHCYVIRYGLDCDVYVGTSLIDMYVKNYNLIYAQAVFHSMKNRHIFAWNSLISGYSFKGQFEDAIKLLNRMENEGIKPDLVTYNSLVSGYSMWGWNEKALTMIHRIKVSGLTPNVVTWTALISGCAQKGNFRDALEFSIRMQKDGIKPNSVTMASLLQACAGMSSLQKGKEIHCLGIRNELAEDPFAATALIDMYTKCGSLESAYEVFRRIQDKTLPSWNCMITGFALYSRGKEAISLFNEMQEAEDMRELLEVKVGKIGKVWSWIQINHTGHLFSAKGKAHPDEGEIYFELYQLVSEMKNLGYIPDVKCVFQSVDRVEKEKVLLTHTEKLAVMYGLLKTGSSAPIRVIKNTRVCSDCHMFAKYASLMKCRDILLKDGVRFHHFREGKCSCNDFW
ncbi:pentatricopeptide (PPR) repeat-containing protein [Actinidia rufa]|uniref:Pentatricopeptide (PPR) repeat-containing protein n=1 Tax=Actinidia rufa TaxID=165716 RepID=A0A7J0FFG9_9ERIC|nr:pentatricopeptide (PPR) repeat-containing protein [Actinidia rufa]